MSGSAVNNGTTRTDSWLKDLTKEINGQREMMRKIQEQLEEDPTWAELARKANCGIPPFTTTSWYQSKAAIVLDKEFK